MATPEEYINNAMEDCIENCTERHRICLETIEYYLRMSGKHADAARILRLADCAQICQTTLIS